jgi:hypothetical protein
MLSGVIWWLLLLLYVLCRQRINTAEQRKPVLETLKEAVWFRMNMTQDCKLSYTEVYPIRRMYRNSVFSRNSRKLPIISTSILRNEEYHNQIKPMLNVLRLLGMLPLKMSSHGEYVWDVTYLIFVLVIFDGLVVLLIGEVTWKGSHITWNSGEYGCNCRLNKWPINYTQTDTNCPSHDSSWETVLFWGIKFLIMTNFTDKSVGLL